MDWPGSIRQSFSFYLFGRHFSFFEMTSYVLMFASTPMFFYGVKLYTNSVLLSIAFTIITLYSGLFAAIIWNDITDVEIDTIVHPKRWLPTKKISVKWFFIVALFFSSLTFIFSLLISFWCFILVGCTALFVTFHNKYLKKRMKLPAYSEIFTPFQWIVVPIFGFLAMNSSNFQDLILLVAFTYFADNAHDLPEGIHDIQGDYKIGIRTYATSFGEKLSAKISFAMFFISGVIGIVLFLRTPLSYIFLIPFLILWAYTLSWSYSLIKSDKNNMRKMGKIVGKIGFNYFLGSYSLIFFDIVVQLIHHHYVF